MRIALAIISLVLGTLQLQGQINPMDKLFKDKPRDLAIYINPTFQYSQIALQRTSIAGIGAGVVINKKFTLGAIGYTSIKNITLPEAYGSGTLQLIWGGLHLEYTLWPLQIIHLTFPLSAGMGQLKITGNTVAAPTGTPNFLFAEPGMMIEANIWSYFKLGIGTSYRYTANVDYNSLTSADLNGFSAVVSFKIGKFRYGRRR